MYRGHPIAPKHKSLKAKCFTTELTCWKPPKSDSLLAMYKTIPFPKALINPIRQISTTEIQKTASFSLSNEVSSKFSTSTIIENVFFYYQTGEQLHKLFFFFVKQFYLSLQIDLLFFSFCFYKVINISIKIGIGFLK